MIFFFPHLSWFLLLSFSWRACRNVVSEWVQVTVLAGLVRFQSFTDLILGHVISPPLLSSTRRVFILYRIHVKCWGEGGRRQRWGNPLSTVVNARINVIQLHWITGGLHLFHGTRDNIKVLTAVFGLCSAGLEGLDIALLSASLWWPFCPLSVMRLHLGWGWGGGLSWASLLCALWNTQTPTHTIWGHEKKGTRRRTWLDGTMAVFMI